jgi:hypothetical protein
MSFNNELSRIKINTFNHEVSVTYFFAVTTNQLKGCPLYIFLKSMLLIKSTIN